MVESVRDMQSVIASAAKLLMIKDKESYASSDIHFDVVKPKLTWMNSECINFKVLMALLEL